MRITPIDFLSKRWGWRWVPLVVAVLILVCTALYAWLRPELYRSETRILVEPKTVFDRELSAAEAKDSIQDQIQNMQQMLESRTIRQRIIEEFKLRSDDTSVSMEDALKAMREHLEIPKTSGNPFTVAYYATSPQAAQAITKRLTDVLIDVNHHSQEAAANEKVQFLRAELEKLMAELAVIDRQISLIRTHAGGRQDLPEQQALLREQAQLQWQMDQISRMKLNADMASNFMRMKNGAGMRILDEASLPERPEFPARLHILSMGIAAALIAALPAVFMQKKAPSHSA
jgi:polysaccharide biosynthesis transport protein